MFDKLMEEFVAASRALALEEITHKVRKAKAEADQAEFIFAKVKESITEQTGVRDIMSLKGGNFQ